MTDLISLWTSGGVLLWACMTLLWLLSLRLHDSSIVDVFWGLGFLILTGWTYWAGAGYPVRSLLVLILVAVWAVRLAGYIGRRNLGTPEDPRYQTFREKAGASYWWVSYAKVFMLQGVLISLIAAPLLVAVHAPAPTVLTGWDYAGVTLWLLGFGFEAIGDAQMARFKAHASPGEVLDTGLWRYTRHPNYFGEAVLWWGYFCFAMAVGAYWTIFSPLLMTWLLLRVSGVALLEKNLSKSKPAYAEYRRKTAPFIPWPPKD